MTGNPGNPAFPSNEGTTLMHIEDALASRPIAPAEAWSAARLRMERARAEHPGRACLAGVVAVPGQPADAWRAFARFTPPPSTEAPATEVDLPLSVTLGRHERCAAPLPSSSLRHVTVLAWPGGEDPEILAVDLRSGTSLVVDGKPAVRVSGARAVAFTAGAATVLLATAPAGAGFDGVPVPAGACLRIDARGPETAEHSFTDGTHAGPRPGSFAGYVRRLAERGTDMRQLGWAGSVVQAFVAPDGTFRGPDGRIVHPGRWATLSVEEEPARRGILVGRYERCERSRFLQAAGNVSRVHALLLLHRGRLWAVDTASANGSELMRGPDLVELRDEDHPVAEARGGDTLRMRDLWLDLAAAPVK